MPYIQFDLPREPGDGDFHALAAAVAGLYAEVMQTAPSGSPSRCASWEHGACSAMDVPWLRSGATSAAAGPTRSARRWVSR
jgi:hypothetical protein